MLRFVLVIWIAGPCFGRFIPSGDLERLKRTPVLRYLANTFMNTSAAIVKVLQQGHSAFHSVHTHGKMFGHRRPCLCCREATKRHLSTTHRAAVEAHLSNEGTAQRFGEHASDLSLA